MAADDLPECQSDACDSGELPADLAGLQGRALPGEIGAQALGPALKAATSLLSLFNGRS
jgi:hypothetical protein